ncbi:MAG: hypothetical protein H7039_02935 [Bryobacteraceae bacterium]|nr:hypothetical protein [Bryobacteraceae bacterium]
MQSLLVNASPIWRYPVLVARIDSFSVSSDQLLFGNENAAPTTTPLAVRGRLTL